MKKQDDYRDVVKKRIRRKKSVTSFYSNYPKGDTRFNVKFERPSFGGPGTGYCGWCVHFGQTKKAMEIEKQR